MQDIDIKSLLKPLRVTEGKGFRLADHAADDKRGLDIGEEAVSQAALAGGIKRVSKLQELLYADNRWSVLIIFQAMDAAGKDGAIKHVMTGINPQGVQAHAFKAPSEAELDHDFLWRTTRCLPERGCIGLFNRSYYEEVLVVRVHPEFLKKQRLPRGKPSAKLWKARYESITDFEKHLARNGTRVIKFFLNVSPEEQKKRLLDRIDDPSRNWKFDPKDVAERAHWSAYMAAYEEMIRATARKRAPWYVIPADDKDFARVAVMAAIIHELERLGLAVPKAPPDVKDKLQQARAVLMSQS